MLDTADGSYCCHYTSWAGAQPQMPIVSDAASHWEGGVSGAGRKAVKALAALFRANQAKTAQACRGLRVMLTDGREQAEAFTSHLASVTLLRKPIFSCERVVQSLCSEEIADWGAKESGQQPNLPRLFR